MNAAGSMTVANANACDRPANGLAFENQHTKAKSVQIRSSVTVSGNCRRTTAESLSFKLLEDPGLPHGSSTSENVYATEKVLTYTFAPTQKEQIGKTFPVCFQCLHTFANGVNGCGDAEGCTVQEETCFSFTVTKPTLIAIPNPLPSFLDGTNAALTAASAALRLDYCNPASGTSATVGCAASFKVCSQNAMNTNIEVVSHTLVSHHGSPNQVVAGLPVGAATAAEYEYGAGLLNYLVVGFTPQHGHEGYTVRFNFKVKDYQSSVSDLLWSTDVNVQRCIYCTAVGESLKHVAERYNMEWLGLWTANPAIENPQNIAATPIFIGSNYKVKKEDTLYDLARRFSVDLHTIKRANADVDIASGSIVAGQDLCIVPAVCNQQSVDQHHESSGTLRYRGFDETHINK